MQSGINGRIGPKIKKLSMSLTYIHFVELLEEIEAWSGVINDWCWFSWMWSYWEKEQLHWVLEQV